MSRRVGSSLLLEHQEPKAAIERVKARSSPSISQGRRGLAVRFSRNETDGRSRASGERPPLQLGVDRSAGPGLALEQGDVSEVEGPLQSPGERGTAASEQAIALGRAGPRHRQVRTEGALGL